MLRRLKFILLGLFIILVGVIWYFTTTPYYSLMMCMKAVKNKDVNNFEYYCDTDSLCASIVDGIMNMETDLLGKDVGGMLKSLHGDPQKIPFAKIMMSKAIKMQLIKSIKELKQNTESSFTGNKSDFEILNSFERVYNSQQDAVVLKFQFEVEKDKIAPLDIRLRKLNGIWKVVGIESLAELIKVYNPFLSKRS